MAAGFNEFDEPFRRFLRSKEKRSCRWHYKNEKSRRRNRLERVQRPGNVASREVVELWRTFRNSRDRDGIEVRVYDLRI